MIFVIILVLKTIILSFNCSVLRKELIINVPNNEFTYFENFENIFRGEGLEYKIKEENIEEKDLNTENLNITYKFVN